MWCLPAGIRATQSAGMDAKQKARHCRAFLLILDPPEMVIPQRLLSTTFTFMRWRSARTSWRVSLPPAICASCC